MPLRGRSSVPDCKPPVSTRNLKGRVISSLPYTSYALLSSDDVLAIRAYLATVAPVATPALANALAFPFNQRPIMRRWKLLFLESNPFEPDPARGVAWNRGAYLVNGLAHCSECHTPRDLMFAWE
jgi:mono/diheme cytochrome c family protein